jgi:hypothetical protein
MGKYDKADMNHRLEELTRELEAESEWLIFLSYHIK